MTRDADIIDALRRGVVTLPPLEVELVGVEPKSSVPNVQRRAESAAETRADRPDAYVDVRLASKTYRFVAAVKVQATPKSFREAIDRIERAAAARERRPMIVTPYLAPDRLKELEKRGISGIDLSGNGIVVVPGEVFVRCTGAPNRFPTGRRIRDVYQGASSLVARVFLARPRFESVQAVMDEIASRGGRVALSTVSKVLQVLDDDLVIRRQGRSSELLQADKLLERLAGSFRPPRIDARKLYRWSGSREELIQRLGASGEKSSSAARIVLTGAASVDAYAIMPREDTVQCYCESIEAVREKLGDGLEESSRFPDLELIETRDPTVYFDGRGVGAGARPNTGTLATASPVQCWLELSAGDKRQQDASRTVREGIFESLRASGWSAP